MQWLFHEAEKNKHHAEAMQALTQARFGFKQ